MAGARQETRGTMSQTIKHEPRRMLSQEAERLARVLSEQGVVTVDGDEKQVYRVEVSTEVRTITRTIRTQFITVHLEGNDTVIWPCIVSDEEMEELDDSSHPMSHVWP